MRVAVVGAGVAGLGAARTLRHGGCEVVVFEKSRRVGGRVSTRRIGDYIFDPGASSIAPRGRRLEAVMQRELDTGELVRIAQPIYTHHMGRISPGDAAKMAVERYAYRSGNVRLAELLAEGLDVRLDSPISGLVEGRKGYGVAGEIFDAAVLALPIPQTQAILEAAGIERPLANARYRPCVCVMLAYESDLGERPYHAILDPDQRHPMTWLSLDSVKCPGRAPEGCSSLVAQLGPQYSVEHYDDTDEAIIDDAAGHVARFYGSGFGAPVHAQVKRWRYSQPETTATFASVNRPGSRLLVASDGLLGGRVEFAFECGAKVADLLLTTLAAPGGRAT